MRTDSRLHRNLNRFARRRAAESALRPRQVTTPEVLVPCFNHGEFLADAVASVAAQKCASPIHLTIKDDKSTDDSALVADELRQQYACQSLVVRTLSNERNMGQAGALNRAIASSEADVFTVLNADDVLAPDCLRVVTQLLCRHPQLFMLGSTSVTFREVVEVERLFHDREPDLDVRVYTPEDALHFTAMRDLNMTQSSCSFLRSAWQAVGGYFPRQRRVCSYDDRDFQMRVCSLFPVGVLENYALAGWRDGSSMGRATR